ncbi:hypothetical protein CIB84_017112, partial [Bambusicola thoracicus]
SVYLSPKRFGAFSTKLSALKWGSVNLQSCDGGGGSSIEQTRSSPDLQSTTAALTSPSSSGPRWGTRMLRSTSCSGLGARRELCNFSPAFGLEGETAESEPRGAQQKREKRIEGVTHLQSLAEASWAQYCAPPQPGAVPFPFARCATAFS